MPTRNATPGERVLSLWRRLAPLPLGRVVFMWVLGRLVPYSGALGARVLALEPGFARVQLHDRRAIRNHLGSVHAIALANLGELTSGMAMTAALPAGVRAIVTRIEVTYAKKARGPLIAESRVELPGIRSDVEHEVRSEIRDAAGDVVATVVARWRLGLTTDVPVS
jgi:acyl-coenzyme A thioesterase PaaI-like protein